MTDVATEIAPARHPAKFSDPILAVIQEQIDELVSVDGKLIDPFAGTGRVHELQRIQTIGVELEKPWADQHPNTIVGDATALPFPDESFDACATSCCYGNRMADSHNAKERCSRCSGGVIYGPGGFDLCTACDGKGVRAYKRITYTHLLGRKLHPNNSGAMYFWSKAYKDLHQKAWAESTRVLKPGGVFILNTSNFIRKGEVQYVTLWHTEVLKALGLELVRHVPVKTARMGFGANRDARVDHETVTVLRKP